MTLTFRMGRIPVRILPSFFITTVIINFGLAQSAPQKLLLWTAIVLASVLAHELGHAIAGLVFGLNPRIDLHGFGGTTSWQGAPSLSSAKRIVISLAGPGMGFAMGGVVALSLGLFGPGLGYVAGALLGAFGLGPPVPESSLADFTAVSLLFVNVGWGVLNLLPMLPLDGGNVMKSTLDIAMDRGGERAARIISLAVALIVTPIALVVWSPWSALLGASFVASNWRGLRELRAREHDAPMRATLETAYQALDAKDAARVLAIARPVALGSQTAPVRAEALQLLAFGFLLEGRIADADAAIAALPRGFAPHPTLLELRAARATGAPS
jgi:Zn-dependent protease